jgi:hypothetical protein
MYSQTPFSIFEPFYGGIVNSKQSNLGKVHENAVPCSLVNAMIIRSQRVMQQCVEPDPTPKPDPVIFLNAAMLRKREFDTSVGCEVTAWIASTAIYYLRASRPPAAWTCRRPCLARAIRA